ncbi:hypothetical protein EJ02DRAFT_449909 [Clathrospora elynae]|uniref:Uncharacterized protein n=1 Tax=Clathrospora elynae TaxID=706981 RepID=A0A6A5T3Z4_9PLEO|nr:hypothetical protein EJ02DRAFT_449909 [Clathrospora elynae]
MTYAMNSNDATQLQAETSKAVGPSSQAHAYVHLYLPLITIVFHIFCTPTIARFLGFTEDEGWKPMLLVAFSAIPTYLLGSLVYPANRPDPSPEERIRFTRKNYLYRAAVIFTYGRLYGTPFNIIFYTMDLVCSFAADVVIGERLVGAPQRQSEFLVALLWVAGSAVLQRLIPISNSGIGVLVGAADRTLWRTAYVALVDDVVGVLTRPDVRTLTGKGTLILLQTFTIMSFVILFFAWLRRFNEPTNEVVGPAAFDTEAFDKEVLSEKAQDAR